MEGTKIVIIGTGPESRIAADVFLGMGIDVLGFISTEAEITVHEWNDINVFAKLGDKDAKAVLSDKDLQYIVALGDLKDRRKVYEAIASMTKRPSTTGTHPLAGISPNAKIGFGNLFNMGCYVNPNATVGDMNIFHTGSSVEPDAVIGNYCTFSPGVRIGTRCVIEDDVFIGTGAVIYPGVKVGQGAMIGAGSVVLREVKKGQAVHGNPAKEA